MTNRSASTDFDLGQVALLYLAGELESPRLEEFEERLETDQTAQEQLALAVELTELLRSNVPRPDPAYRDAVRRKIVPLPQSRSWFGVRLWVEFAVAVCLLLATWSVARIDPPSEATIPTVALVEPEAEPEREISATEAIDERIDLAAAWAEMSNVDHYQKADEDDQRRKSRFRETGQLMIPTLMGEYTATLD